MSEDRFHELAALAALDVLDGEDRLGFEAHLPTCPDCQAETLSYRKVVTLLPLALEGVAPQPGVRSRVLGTRGPSSSMVLLAATLLVSLGITVWSWRERDAARQEVRDLRAATDDRFVGNAKDKAVLEERLEQEGAFRTLASLPGSRLARLTAPRKPAEAAVVWNTKSDKAILLASGLDDLPKGRAYELWVIAGGAPVPAGVFAPNPLGRAVLTFPIVKDIARVKTFAVSVEPAEGSQTPTGDIVLAGPPS
jgi:anti-sigma-K factor RskA